jgi:hypothetical protein
VINEEKNEELFDTLLKMSISDALKKEMNTLPSNDELNGNFKSSIKLNERIKKLTFHRKIKSKIIYFVKSVSKIAACVIIIMALSSIALFSVEATRNIIFNSLVDKFSNYTQINFEESVTDNMKTNSYRPTYLPKGFKKISTQTYGNTILQIYSNESNGEIVFKQRPAEEGTTLIDNENTKYKEVEISGNTAYLFEALTQEDYSVLIWQAEGTVFELTAQINSEELVFISNSLEK